MLISVLFVPVAFQCQCEFLYHLVDTSPCTAVTCILQPLYVTIDTLFLEVSTTLFLLALQNTGVKSSADKVRGSHSLAKLLDWDIRT